MITRIELENFKGIRDRVALDLKPITLLFGANSSGKSTVIHALHYALEVLRYQNLDADRTTLGGESVDLGGFRNLVHGHDLDRRISMLFEFDLEGTLPDYTQAVSDLASPPGDKSAVSDVAADLDEQLLSGWIRVVIGWSRALQRPTVFGYELGANGGDRDKPLIRIESGTGRSQLASLVFRVDDGLFAVAPGDGTTMAELAADAGLSINDGCTAIPVYQESAVPDWGRPLRMVLPGDMTSSAFALAEVRRTVSKLAVGMGVRLTEDLERLVYLGPLRTVPPRNYRPPLTEDLARWPEGLAAWDVMHRQGARLVSRVSEWMVKLGTGYRIELRKVRELDGTLADRLQQLALSASFEEVDLTEGQPRRAREREAKLRAVRAAEAAAETRTQLAELYTALAASSSREELVLVDERSGVEVRPADVGVGISQVLPVIVAALYRGRSGAGRFLVVEQPELHIHPKLQVKLADLFIEQSGTGTLSDHSFLLETHSEHILLRLLRRIREATERKEQEEGGVGNVPRKNGVGASSPANTDPVPARNARRKAPPTRSGGVGSVRGRGVGQHGREDDEDDDAPKPVPFTPDRVSVVYVQRKEDGSTDFVPLRIDENGEFRDVWPEGFFDERLEELL